MKLNAFVLRGVAVNAFVGASFLSETDGFEVVVEKLQKPFLPYPAGSAFKFIEKVGHGVNIMRGEDGHYYTDLNLSAEHEMPRNFGPAPTTFPLLNLLILSPSIFTSHNHI